MYTTTYCSHSSPSFAYLEIIIEKTARHRTSGPLWLKITYTHTHTHTWCTRPWAEQGVQWCDVQAALCVKAILRQNIHYEWSRAFCRGKAVSAGGVQVSIFEKSFDKLYLRNVRYTLVPPCHFILLSFFVRKPDNIQRKCVFFCTHVFSESCCNIIALLLQAWRRYDTDRSGYIESNELKVKHNMPNSASCSWLM